MHLIYEIVGKSRSNARTLPIRWLEWSIGQDRWLEQNYRYSYRCYPWRTLTLESFKHAPLSNIICDSFHLASAVAAVVFSQLTESHQATIELCYWTWWICDECFIYVVWFQQAVDVTMSFSSDEVNYLVYRYLLESGN